MPWAIEQQLVKLSADVKELGQEASSIASATEQTLDDLLRHFEELQKVSQVPKVTSPRRHSRAFSVFSGGGFATATEHSFV